MKKQYMPNIIDVLSMGFEREITEDRTGEIYSQELRYVLKGINMTIEYNPEIEEYAWYMVTTIGEGKNSINLDIQEHTDLDNLLFTLKFQKGN